ncbi:MAG: biotin/lipoyl-containing protein [Planctomycetota bacterium]|jgi:biotin carboxyl carrier protein|nr:biotin/lipoyl-containing protein [Planctomycetota bacterium]
MKYFLKTQSGREFELEIEDGHGDSYAIRIGDRTIQADFTDVDRLGQHAAILDGRSYAASIEESDEQHLLVNIAGESFTIIAQDEREKAADAVASQGPPKAEVVKASMPGVIISLAVDAGDVLEAGAPVAVLEAMKMQNEVACAHGGVVEEVLIEAGQSVEANQALIKLAPAPQK